MENILFIRLRLLGDIIFTIPALYLYKKHFPENKIYYVVEEKFQEMAEVIPAIDNVLVVSHKMNMKQILDFRKMIKKIGFNTVVDFHSGPKSALLTRMSGLKTRIGYRTPNRNWAYNHLTPRKPHDFSTHSVYNQAKLLEHLGIDITTQSIPAYPSIHFPGGSAEKKIKNDLSGKRKITIHAGAGNRFRDWGIENFSTLIKILKNDNFTIFVIGNTEKEKQRGQYLKRNLEIIDLTGKLSFKDLLYLISNSDIYLGFDSGPLHLASLTHTPIVALYGPNIPEISGPWRKNNVTILQANLNCRPCSQKKCIYDTIRCIEDIKVDDVYKAIKQYIY